MSGKGLQELSLGDVFLAEPKETETPHSTDHKKEEQSLGGLLEGEGAA